MSALSDTLHRDERGAKLEASRGLNHACYLFIIVCGLLRKLGCEVRNHLSDPVLSGAHWGHFVDPITGLEYEIRVIPVDKKR